MPSEPHRKVDEALKACAEDRRQKAGQPFEMHSTTRKLLQAEVARTYGGSRSAGGSKFFVLANLWPRLIAGGIGVAALVLGAGVWLRLDKEREMRLAMGAESNQFFFGQSGSELGDLASAKSDGLADRLRHFELGEPAPQPSTPTQPLTETAGPNELLARAPEEEPSEADSRRMELALALPATQPDLDPDMLSNAPRFQFRVPAAPSGNPALEPKAEAMSEPATAEAQARLNETESIVAARDSYGIRPDGTRNPAAETEARVASAAPAQQNLAQLQAPPPANALYFQQIDSRAQYRRNLNSPPPPQVLTSFALQRSGDSLRIVDADGSVYEGRVEPAPQNQMYPQTRTALVSAAKATLADRVQPAPAAATASIQPTMPSQSPAEAQFSFSCIGTNRTVNQLVVFTGEFMPTSPATGQEASRNRAVAVGDAQMRNRYGLQVQAGGTSSQAQSQDQKGRIQGQAAIGQNTQLRIEALQVPQ